MHCSKSRSGKSALSPTHKLVQLHPFQPAEHCVLIQYPYEAHADSLPHLGVHNRPISNVCAEDAPLENHLGAERRPPEWEGA